MHFSRPAMAALLIGACAPLACIAPGFAQTCECPPPGFSSGPVIESDEPPPPLPEYDQPPIPAEGYYWTPGYWAWNNYDYYWVPGVWVEPPQPGLLWTPGYWAFVGGVYAFHRGYWAPHVGFYGGVNYGYGYDGRGYGGGRWDNGRFFYNSTVNNFGAARVTNVYSEPVPAPRGVGRASFNGGPGGIFVKPTPEQERLTTEEHVRPTPLQVSHAREASVTPEQFSATNKGKPAIAATPRPGDFKGAGVVPARAAGAAETVPPAGPTGQPPAPNGGPKEEQKLPQPPAGQLPNGALKQTLPGEKPIKPEPLSAPKLEPKLPASPVQPVPPPNGAQKLQEKLPGASPNAVIRPPGSDKPVIVPPKALERQPAIERPQGLERQIRPEPQNLGAPNGLQRPPVGERPPAPAMAPAQQARPQPAPNAPIAPRNVERLQPKPGAKPLCGQPGLPPCPK
jgi:hypothetical protein